MLGLKRVILWEKVDSIYKNFWIVFVCVGKLGFWYRIDWYLVKSGIKRRDCV